jgi:RNA polymerase sigma-70 factor (ECF subfamily)
MIAPNEGSFLAADPPAQEREPLMDGEAALLDRAQAGDRDAFSALVCSHLGTLYCLVRRITRNREDAEDAVQDAILKAFENLPQFQRRARFSTWISRIAINEGLMKLRRRRLTDPAPGNNVLEPEELSPRAPSTEQYGMNPEALYAWREIEGLMLHAAGSLLPMYHAVFYLTQVKGCTNEEAAKQLAVSVSTIKSRLHRARKQLRERMNWIERA